MTQMTLKNLKHYSFILIFFLLLLPNTSLAVDCTTPTNPTLVFPSAPDEVWYICQGYNGQISHQGKMALDLSVAPNSIGANGCTPSTANSSAGHLVTAPSDGEIVWIGTNSTDIMCFNLSNGGSLKIGHLYMSVNVGQIVSQGDTLGYMSAAAPLNGNYAHYHIEPFIDNGCISPDPSGFANLFGGDVSLAPDGSANQWSGATLSPLCGALAGTAINPFDFTNPFLPQHPNYEPPVYIPYEAYVSQYNIVIDTGTVTTVVSPVVDDSLIGVMIRLVKEGIKYGPWLLALMIVITGFMFITSMGITTRIMRARRAFQFTIIGTIVVLSVAGIMELMEATLLSQWETIFRYFV